MPKIEVLANSGDEQTSALFDNIDFSKKRNPSADEIKILEQNGNFSSDTTWKNIFVDENTISELLALKVDFVIDAIDSLDSKCLLLEELWKSTSKRESCTKVKLHRTTVILSMFCSACRIMSSFLIQIWWPFYG